MKKFALVLVLLQISVIFAGCSPNVTTPKTTEKIKITESIPTVTFVDSLKLRSTKITQHWKANASPILYNFINLYNCEIVKVEGEEYPYRMWIFGETSAQSKYLGYDSIYYARGKDLNTWEVYCGNDAWDTTMTPSLWSPVMVHDKKSYDSIHNGDPTVVFKDGVFYMAFSSVGFEERAGVTYIINCVMGATSTDGINWTKTSAPILIWEKEYVEGWDSKASSPPSVGAYHRPSLLWDEEEGKWKIWFDYYLPGTFLSMGYAVNNGDFKNPEDWQVIHAGQNPQLKNWPNPEVVKINGYYYAFSDAPGFGAVLGAQNDRQIVMAVSVNGWDWTVVGRVLPEDKMYGTHLPQTFVEKVDGELYLYVFYSMVENKNLPKYSKANYMKIAVSELESLVGKS